jgi:hypothetical protein
MKSSIYIYNLHINIDIDDVNKALGDIHEEVELRVANREFKDALSE